jgi:citrate lyase subunit beta/citryl-CoA lyase
MRSLLYVPAHSERFIAKAHERGADGIILDLEDSVPAEDKQRARDGLADSVSAVRQGGAVVLVRINAGDQTDALAACRAGADGLLVPKVESPDHFVALVRALEPVEAQLGRPPMQFVALLETPGAILDARTIATAPRLIGMMTGGEDLALSLGGQPTPEVLRLPKLLVHYAAKASGLMSLGLLRSVADYADIEGIASAAQEAREHGFDGATCVHPTVVPVLNAGFSPTEAERDWARRVVEAAEQHAGAFSLDGQMIDAPVIARARRIVGQ